MVPSASATLSLPAAVSPAKQKTSVKRSSAPAQASGDRASGKRTNHPSSKHNAAVSFKEDTARSSSPEDGQRHVRVVEPENQADAASSPQPITALQQTPGKVAASDLFTNGAPASTSADAPVTEPSPKVAGRLPAFTGDPRNKGFANMMATLGGRRRKNGAA